MYKIWRSGAKGEEKDSKCLKHLGSRYPFFHDEMLSRKRGDVDHVVIGSNRVFVIETKNNNGVISCSGDSCGQWETGKEGGSYRGKLGSHSKQAKRNASLLDSLVRRHLHTRLYVNPLLVFANEKAALNIK